MSDVMTDEQRQAAPIAIALSDAMKRWDDEADDDMTFQECLMEGWNLSEFIALVFVRDGLRLTKQEA